MYVPVHAEDDILPERIPIAQLADTGGLCWDDNRIPSPPTSY